MTSATSIHFSTVFENFYCNHWSLEVGIASKASGEYTLFCNFNQKNRFFFSKKLKITLPSKVNYLQKNTVWDFFLELDVEFRKNINFGNFHFLFADLTVFTWNDPPWKLLILKIIFKKNLWRSHRFHFWNWIAIMYRNLLQNLKNIKNTVFELLAVEWEQFLKKKLRLCWKMSMKANFKCFETIKNWKNGKFCIKKCICPLFKFVSNNFSSQVCKIDPFLGRKNMKTSNDSRGKNWRFWKKCCMGLFLGIMHRIHKEYDLGDSRTMVTFLIFFC